MAVAWLELTISEVNKVNIIAGIWHNELPGAGQWLLMESRHCRHQHLRVLPVRALDQDSLLPWRCKLQHLYVANRHPNKVLWQHQRVAHRHPNKVLWQHQRVAHRHPNKVMWQHLHVAHRHPNKVMWQHQRVAHRHPNKVMW